MSPRAAPPAALACLVTADRCSVGLWNGASRPSTDRLPELEGSRALRSWNADLGGRAMILFLILNRQQLAWCWHLGAAKARGICTSVTRTVPFCALSRRLLLPSRCWQQALHMTARWRERFARNRPQCRQLPQQRHGHGGRQQCTDRKDLREWVRMSSSTKPTPVCHFLTKKPPGAASAPPRLVWTPGGQHAARPCVLTGVAGDTVCSVLFPVLLPCLPGPRPQGLSKR